MALESGFQHGATVGNAGPISFVVWALAGFSVLFDDVDKSLSIFIELSDADPR